MVKGFASLAAIASKAVHLDSPVFSGCDGFLDKA
jgi:hypothetical protein